MQLARIVVALAAAAALAACGRPNIVVVEPVATKPAPPPPPAPAVASHGGHLAGSGGGGGRGGRSAPAEAPSKIGPPPELEIRLLVHNRVVARGAPIEVLVEVVNVSQEPVKLIDGRADLARRTRFIVQRNGVEIVAGPGTPAASALSRDEDVTLAPGQVLASEVDLLMPLEDTIAYVDGRIRFVAEYQGASSAVRSGSRGWNSDPGHVVRSKQFDLELRLPDWLLDLGATNAIYVDARNAAATFQPGMPGSEKTAAAFAQKGAPGMACLLAITRSMGAMDEQRVEVGRRAFALLRTIGEPAHTALSRAYPGEDPAMRMTLGVLLEDHDERSGVVADHGVSKALRDVGSGGPEATAFAIHFLQTKSLESATWVLDGNGILTVERGANDSLERTSIKLPIEPFALLKGAILASRFATWRRTQRVEAEDEGSVSFVLCQGDTTVHRISLPETEALTASPLVAPLVEAFRHIATAPISKGTTATPK